MEFIESLSRGNSASRMTRLTITLISERSSWVSVSKSLANQLFSLNVLPVVLQIRVLDGAGFPSKQPQHTHHVAWTGSVIHAPAGGSGAGSYTSGGTLGVPSSLASALGLRAGSQVQVAPVLDVPGATSVEVEPEDENDWEVLESNADFLEQQLLGQVGVLARGQNLTVWARGGAAVRLRVLSTQPADLVRLVPGAEMHVAPKPRGLIPFGGGQGQQQAHGGVGRQNGQGRGQTPMTGTVVPLTGRAAEEPPSVSSSGTENVGRGGSAAAPWQQPQQQQQHTPQHRNLYQRTPSFKWGPSANGSALTNGNGNGCQGNDSSRSSNSSFGRESYSPGFSISPAQWQGLPLPQRDGTMTAAAAAAAAAGTAAAGGVGLQAPPTWASGLPRPKSGRFAQDPGNGGGGSGYPSRHQTTCAQQINGSPSPFASVDSTAAGAVVPEPLLPSSSSAPPAVTSHVASAPAPSTDPAGTVAPLDTAAAAAPPLPPPLPPPASKPAPRSLSQPPPSSRPLRLDLPLHHQPQSSAVYPHPRPHPHRCYHPRALNPVPLRLRVLDLPPSKYLVPLPPMQPSSPSLLPRADGPPAVDSEQQTGTSSQRLGGNPSPPPSPPTPVVSAWLTLAVAVAPATAAALVGGSTAGHSGFGAGGVVVQLHGRGTVRDLLGVLVPEPACPIGHVMLAPPLQHVLCVLPHMYVTVTALPASMMAPAEAEAEAPTLLHSLTLHPLPVPALRSVVPAGAVGRGGGGETATSLRGCQSSGRSASTVSAEAAEAVHHQQAVMAAGGSLELVAAAAAASQAISHAVSRWLAAQVEGIRRAILGSGCPPSADRRNENIAANNSTTTTVAAAAAAGSGAWGGISSDGGEALELLLPIASGTVVHFHIHGMDCGNSASTKIHCKGMSLGGGGGGSLPLTVASGDYCLIVHALRRTHTNGTASAQHTPPMPPTPPLISERTIGALLQSPAHSISASGQALFVPQPSAQSAAAVAAAATAAVAASSGTFHGGPTSQQPLVTKLGQPIVLPDVLYDTAHHAAVLAQRPLPPPLQPAAQRPAQSLCAIAAMLKPTSDAPCSVAPARTTEATGADAECRPMAAAEAAEEAAAAPPQALSEESKSKAASPATAPMVLDLDLDLGHIIWLREQLEQCLRRLLPQIDPWASAAMARAGLPRCGGVLVTGAPGTGRSQLLAALGDFAERHPAHQAHVIHVRCGYLAGGSRGAIMSTLSAVGAEALHCGPCLLLMDDLDLLCPSAAEGSEYGMQHPEGTAAAARLADWLSALLDELSAATATAVEQSEAVTPAVAAGAAAWTLPPAVAIVASARDAASLHPALRRVGRLDFEVRLPTPGSVGRAAMLAAAARQQGLAVDADHLAAVAGAAEGFEGVDLRLLLDRAVHVALRRQLNLHPLRHQKTVADPLVTPMPPAANAGSSSDGSGGSSAAAAASSDRHGLVSGRRGVALAVSGEDLREALEGFVPAPFWGVQQASAAVGKAEGWEDVGGLADVVAALREALLLPVRYRDLVATAPLRLRTGALLYGPPGCGKTHVVAAAVAAVSRIAPVRFLTVKGPELLNKYIGASEAAVRDLFARAAAAAPAVLFFDEFDAIAPPRGHDSTGVTDRVVNQLLTELDGVEGLRGVMVVAATSRPDLIDAALLRPGRLDRMLFCGPPEGSQQRLEILTALSRRLQLALDVDLRRVAEASRGMTGADLGAVLSEAQLLAINESVEEEEEAVQKREATNCQTATGGAGEIPTPTPTQALSTATHAVSDVGAEPAATTATTATATASQLETEAVSDAGSAGAAAGAAAAAPASSPPVFSCSTGGSATAPSRGPKIHMRHLERALAAARPSLPAAEAARLSALYDKFRRDREAPGSRPGPGPGEVTGPKRATLA